MLTQEQLAERRKGIGGSDANRIMDGDWISLWDEKKGHVEPEDLSDVLPVQLGVHTESFNRKWFEKHMNLRVTPDISTTSGTRPYMRANLDGITSDDSVFEAKHVNAFTTMDEVQLRYMPQIQHYLYVTELKQAYLSVIFGNMRWEYAVIKADLDYQAELIECEDEFWELFETNQRPIKVSEPEVTKIKIEGMRVASMSQVPEWSSLASVWRANKSSVTAFKEAEKAIKQLVPDDVRTGFADGIYINRAKNGALTIRELSEKKETELTKLVEGVNYVSEG